MAGSGASCSGMLLRRRRAGEAGIGGFLLAVFACGDLITSECQLVIRMHVHIGPLWLPQMKRGRAQGKTHERIKSNTFSYIRELNLSMCHGRPCADALSCTEGRVSMSSSLWNGLVTIEAKN